jgi:hypothetical protein
MTKIDIKFAELKSPLFFAGTNWGLKLDPGKSSKHSVMILVYDRQEKELIISIGEKLCIIPSSNVNSMEIGKPEMSVPQYTHPIVAGRLQTAQVESPMSHVHAGEGHGKTGIGGKVK